MPAFGDLSGVTQLSLLAELDWGVDPRVYTYLADLIVGVHLAYVSFVVLGLLAVVVGIVFRRSWVRNPWFRWLHLLAIGIVAFEAVMGWECPLTVWERDLRGAAGATAEEGTFVGRLMHGVLVKDDMNFDDPVFQYSYVAFGLLVLLTFLFAPPRHRRAAGTTPPPSVLTSPPAANGASGNGQEAPASLAPSGGPPGAGHPGK